jgi:DNA-binding CsgD family transcriptional regulator
MSCSRPGRGAVAQLAPSKREVLWRNSQPNSSVLMRFQASRARSVCYPRGLTMKQPVTDCLKSRSNPTIDLQGIQSNNSSPQSTATGSTFEAELAGAVVSNYELSFHPTFLLSPTLVVVAANRAARNASKLNGSLRISNNRLLLSDDGLAACIQKFFSSFAESERSAQSERHRVIAESERLRIVLMEVTQLSQRPMFLIQVRDRASEEGFRIEALMDRELTHAEARIALALLGGRTTTEHAAAAGIAVSTARTHLQRAMSKLGVSRQAQLVASLAQMFST